MKIKMNLGDNRKCDTFVCEKCNKTFYDDVWQDKEYICKECKEESKG